MDRVSSAGLSIARELYDFVNSEALPGTGLAPDVFWSGLAAILADLAPRTAALLAVQLMVVVPQKQFQVHFLMVLPVTVCPVIHTAVGELALSGMITNMEAPIIILEEVVVVLLEKHFQQVV